MWRKKIKTSIRLMAAISVALFLWHAQAGQKSGNISVSTTVVRNEPPLHEIIVTSSPVPSIKVNTGLASLQASSGQTRTNPASQEASATEASVVGEENRIATWTRANSKALLGDDHSLVIGNTKGDITLVVWSDYQSLDARNITKTTEQLIQQNPDLRVIFRYLPSSKKSSPLIAQACLAAYLQKKYSEFQDLLFEQDDATMELTLTDIAKKAGLDVQQFERDLNSDFVQGALKKDSDLVNAMNLNKTPKYIVTKTSPNKDDPIITLLGTTSKASIQNTIETVKKH